MRTLQLWRENIYGYQSLCTASVKRMLPPISLAKKSAGKPVRANQMALDEIGALKLSCPTGHKCSVV